MQRITLFEQLRYAAAARNWLWSWVFHLIAYEVMARTGWRISLFFSQTCFCCITKPDFSNLRFHVCIYMQHDHHNMWITKKWEIFVCTDESEISWKIGYKIYTPRVIQEMLAWRTDMWASAAPSCWQSEVPSKTSGIFSKKTVCGTILQGSWCDETQLLAALVAPFWQTFDERLAFLRSLAVVVDPTYVVLVLLLAPYFI